MVPGKAYTRIMLTICVDVLSPAERSEGMDDFINSLQSPERQEQLGWLRSRQSRGRLRWVEVGTTGWSDTRCRGQLCAPPPRGARAASGRQPAVIMPFGFHFSESFKHFKRTFDLLEHNYNNN